MADLGTVHVAGAVLKITALRLGDGVLLVEAAGTVARRTPAGRHPYSLHGPDGVLVVKSPPDEGAEFPAPVRPDDQLALSIRLDLKEVVAHG